jgi:hypothetical protein
LAVYHIIKACSCWKMELSLQKSHLWMRNAKMTVQLCVVGSGVIRGSESLAEGAFRGGVLVPGPFLRVFEARMLLF